MKRTDFYYNGIIYNGKRNTNAYPSTCFQRLKTDEAKFSKVLLGLCTYAKRPLPYPRLEGGGEIFYGNLNKF